MNHTRPERLLTRSILAFVRDRSPTADDFIARFGIAEFHVLRKHGVFVIEDDRLRLSPCCVASDGKWFVWGALWISLETDEIRHVCYGPGGAPPALYDKD